MRELPAEGWRQLGLHLLLVGLVVPLRHPQQKQVLPDAPAQASRQAPPAQVAGQHLPLLVHHLLVSAKHAEELCQSSHQRREHEGGHQQQRQHEASLRPSRGRDVAVADRGHGHDRQPDGRCEGADVIPRLCDVDERGEEERDHQQREQQDGQGLQDIAEGLRQQVYGAPSAQHFQQPHYRDEAEQDDCRRSEWLLQGYSEANGSPERQSCRNNQVQKVAHLAEEHPRCGVDEDPRQQLHREQDVKGGLYQRRCDPRYDWRVDKLQQGRRNGHKKERLHCHLVPPRSAGRLRVLQEKVHGHLGLVQKPSI
mmetsp:Transcript_46820/g.139761  ORF Transcript_46820/g.139761 Transcript_46820/m.139761 type:complete len:310 (-) Transcript_46820:127-1056(-)